MIVMLLFLGSGFVATRTMPAGLGQFADYQPFTPVTETLRGLLTGTPIGTHAIVAIAWLAMTAPIGPTMTGPPEGQDSVAVDKLIE
jgi:ABC-2 type transport system permease protein